MPRNRKANVEVTGSQSVALDGHDYDVGYRATAACIYAPAQLYGPPENCYPDESELNDLEVTITDVQDESGKDVTRGNEAFWATLSIQLDYDRIEEQIWEAFLTD